MASGAATLRRCLVAFISALAIVRVETSGLAGNLQIARSGHQATLLSDGRVLVTGGSDEQGKAIGVSEMFDPTTRTWSPVAPNLAPRLGHAASLLHDGRVLVVGGVPSASSCEPVASAEVYEPSTDRWSMTSNVPVPVGRGTVAVTLKDGRVLISGGGTACGAVHSSAGLFEPSTNTWSVTASMERPAQFHVATLLADGRVVVSGGTDTAIAPDFIASAYDPSTATWSRVPEPRPLSGTACDGYLRTYSSMLRRNSLVARATADDCPSVTVVPAGKLLVAGGLAISNKVLDVVQLSDLRSDEGQASWPMQVPRVGHTATRLENGVVLIAGGRNGSQRLASAELHIPRLTYERLIVGIPRGGTDRISSYDYGAFVAGATNAQRNLVVAYVPAHNVDTAGNPVPHVIEWNVQWWAQRPRPFRYRRHPFVRAFGQPLPEFHSIRIDERGDLWGVSSTAKEVVKFSAEGRVLLRFGKQLENPTDIALDRQGNVFVTDAGERPRIFKFNARGRLLAATGEKGSQPGSLDLPHSLATDASGKVYVADSGNARIQVFDNRLNLRGVYQDIGTPWAICINAGPRQFLYSASNPDKIDESRRSTEIYKLDLDGTILGKAVDEPTLSINASHHLHSLRPNIIVTVGHSYFHQLTFAR